MSRAVEGSSRIDAVTATVPKTVGTLLLLTAMLPVNLAITVTAAAVATARHRRGRPVTNPDPKTIMVSGGKMTKSLQLARSFHRAGHRVVMVEAHKYRYTGHRFSRSVDRFYTVPDPPSDDYAQKLLEIVVQEGVDVYVPVCSPLASYYDARAKELLSTHCEVVHLDADMVATLDNKYEFSVLAESLGLTVPKSFRITDAQQVVDFPFHEHHETFILKSIAYDSVRRLDLTPLPRPSKQATAEFVAGLPISDDNPWIMQAFVSGQEYCTHSTVRDGNVQLHCCCRSSAFQVNYEMADMPEIEAWVRHFVGRLGLTGQVSFDFIASDDGGVFAIECNPRTHSAITMFYNHPGVASAYLDGDVATVRPLASSKPTYWLYHELWRMVTDPASIPRVLRTIARGTDAILDGTDPLPFVLVHHLQVPSLLLANLRRLKGWIRIDFNIGKLIEAGGD